MSASDLKPIQSTEEAKRKGRNGGIKSGESRRKKKLMKDQISLLLSLPFIIFNSFPPNFNVKAPFSPLKLKVFNK